MRIRFLIFTALLLGAANPSLADSSAQSGAFVSPCDQIFANAIKNQPWGMDTRTYELLSQAHTSCLQRETLKQQTRIADAMSKSPQCVSYGKKNETEVLSCVSNGQVTWMGINYKTQKIFFDACNPPGSGANCWIPLPTTKEN